MTDITEQIRRRQALRARERDEAQAQFGALFRHSDAVETKCDPADPLAAALRRTARLSDIDELEVASPDDEVSRRLDRTASLSHLRIASCDLAGEWWREDFVPVLARSREGGAFWCLSHAPGGTPIAWNGATGETFVIDAAFAATLESVAWQLIVPFPPGRVSMRMIFQRLLHGCRKCVWSMLFHSVLMSALACVTPVVTSLVFSDVVPNSDRALLIQLIVLSSVFSVMMCIVYFVHTQNIDRIRTSSSLTLQLALFDRLLRLPVGFFREYRPAELASRLTSCVEAIKQCGAAAVKMLSRLIQLVAPMAMMFVYAPSLAAIVMAVIVLHVTVDALIYKKVMCYKGELFARSGELTGVMERYLKGTDKIRAAGAAGSVCSIWARRFAVVQESFLKSAKGAMVVYILSAILPALLFCTSAAVVVWGYFHDVAGGTLSLADFAGFTSAVSVVSGLATQIFSCLDPILRALPSFRWMKPILEAEEDVADVLPGLTAETFQGAVELNHVTFGYPGGRTILDDVSIRADPGEFVAITGESGAGKSTALRLMLRFERPQAGAVLYDGKDIATCDMKDLRSRFGVVMQAAATLPDTIFRNIVGYGGVHTEEEVWQAAKLAGCDEAIRAFPQQLQTVLSEGSVSGGQRQRFLLAHAFIRKPKIFFLDEATSALDNATQKVVVDSLATMKATRVVIAHRLSTIRDADRIYMLDHGKVAEVGTFDELMAKDGLFARAARRQMIEKEGE